MLQLAEFQEERLNVMTIHYLIPVILLNRTLSGCFAEASAKIAGFKKPS